MTDKQLPYLVYIHGFNSSPQSYKAQQMLAYYQQHQCETRIHIPALSYEPEVALASLRTLVEGLRQKTDETILLIGSSLGGYYATWLTEHYSRLRSVLINPSVKPYELLSEWLGDNENFYTQHKYCLTRQHLKQLLDMDCPQPNQLARFLLLVQTGDETLDYRQAELKFQGADQWIEKGGDHSFTEFERVIPNIIAFVDGPVKRPDSLISI